MPNGDGTGPLGMGPMTGRGCGPCNPNNSGQQVYGGCGRRNQGKYYPNLVGMPVNDELTVRKQQQAVLERQLQTVNDRISKLEQG